MKLPLFNPEANPSSRQINKGSIFFMLGFVLLVSLRIWIISGIPKLYIYGPHDDLYFAKAANALLHGQWMGSYDQLTLIKVPFYTLFLAFSSLTSLPLFLNETLLFLSACLVMFFAIEPLFKNRWWRLLLFAFLAYCPAGMVTDWTLRVYREYVYFSLTLLLVGFSIGLFLRVKQKLKPMIFWAVGMGISMGAFLLTREEGVWIFPALLFFMLCGLLIIWKNGELKKWPRSVILLIPFILAYLPVLAVSYLNYSYYDFWGISDQLDPDFIRVVSTLGRIKTDTTWYPYVRVSRQALDKAYTASPMFAALKDRLNPMMDAWEPISEASFNLKPAWYIQTFSDHSTEIGAGHFPWVLRGAVSDAGYFSDGKYPADYFHNLANELTKACDTQKLECFPDQNIPFVGSIEKRHLPVIAQMFFYEARLFIKLSLINIPNLDFKTWEQYSNYRDDFVYFDQLANNPVISMPGSENSKDMISLKNRIFHLLLTGYRVITPPLSALSVVCFLALLWTSILGKPRQHREYLVILVYLAGLLFSRFSTLVIIDATTTAAGVSYGASNYLFLYVFITTGILGCISELPLVANLKPIHRSARGV